MHTWVAAINLGNLQLNGRVESLNVGRWAVALKLGNWHFEAFGFFCNLLAIHHEG
jgi:hypothetical protein